MLSRIRTVAAAPYAVTLSCFFALCRRAVSLSRFWSFKLPLRHVVQKFSYFSIIFAVYHDTFGNPPKSLFFDYLHPMKLVIFFCIYYDIIAKDVFSCHFSFSSQLASRRMLRRKTSFICRKESAFGLSRIYEGTHKFIWLYHQKLLFQKSPRFVWPIPRRLFPLSFPTPSCPQRQRDGIGNRNSPCQFSRRAR